MHIECVYQTHDYMVIKIGNTVVIKLDAIGDQEYSGKVISILPASASTFSLVPRDIASGEFTKLDQRFRSSNFTR